MSFRHCDTCPIRDAAIRVWPLHCACGRYFESEDDPGELRPREAVAVPGRETRIAIAPDWIADRVQTCAACIDRRGTDCGILVDRNKGSKLTGSRGIPKARARCPAGRWTEKGESIYPVDLTAIRNNGSDRAGEVEIVTFHFNPLRYRRLSETYFEWLPTLGPLAERLIVYEIVFDDDEPEIPGSRILRATRAANLLWQKEAMVNIAIGESRKRYLAWIDHDMVLENPDWLDEALRILDGGSPAVQLMSELCYLDRRGIASKPRRSAMKSWATQRTTDGNPGGAWIANRRYLDQCGRLDTGNIVGGGDQVFYDAMSTGRPGWHVSQYSEPLAKSVSSWIDQARAIRGPNSAGFVDTRVYHVWHGDRKNRQYEKRNLILQEENFDPAADVFTNEIGLLEWSTDKKNLKNRVASYFLDRRDDG